MREHSQSQTSEYRFYKRPDHVRWFGFAGKLAQDRPRQFRVSGARRKIAQDTEPPFHHADRRQAEFSPGKLLPLAGPALAADRSRASSVDRENRQSPESD